MADPYLFCVSHLPPIHILPEYLVIDILEYLEPAPTVNFQEVEREFHLLSHPSHEWLVNSWNGVPFHNRNEIEFYSEVLFSMVPSTSESEMIEYLTRLLGHPHVHSFEQSDEILDKISNLIAKYCGSAVSGGSFRNFLLSNNDASIKVPIQIKELGIANDNIGWKTWGASYPFSQKVIRNNTLFEDIASHPENVHRILELGSGTGLAGVSIVKKMLLDEVNNWTLHLTDLPEIVENLEENIKLNKADIKDKVFVRPLDWKDPSDFKKETQNVKFDFVVVCDCLYSPEHPKLVANTIDEFLSGNGLLYLEIPLREKYEEERNTLWNLLEEKNFEKILEQKDEGFDDYGETDYVFQCYKRK
ncbi:Protein-lysine N-methyltransferase HuEFM2 [Hanseniaspora uvarum DSM 2768]|nr:Protein-lysine N-methyltransferase HuEFM2 [Hanseniaspora uvarum DSM 2768]